MIRWGRIGRGRGWAEYFEAFVYRGFGGSTFWIFGPGLVRRARFGP